MDIKEEEEVLGKVPRATLLLDRRKEGRKEGEVREFVSLPSLSTPPFPPPLGPWRSRRSSSVERGHGGGRGCDCDQGGLGPAEGGALAQTQVGAGPRGAPRRPHALHGGRRTHLPRAGVARGGVEVGSPGGRGPRGARPPPAQAGQLDEPGRRRRRRGLCGVALRGGAGRGGQRGRERAASGGGQPSAESLERAPGRLLRLHRPHHHRLRQHRPRDLLGPRLLHPVRAGGHPSDPERDRRPGQDAGHGRAAAAGASRLRRRGGCVVRGETPLAHGRRRRRLPAAVPRRRRRRLHAVGGRVGLPRGLLLLLHYHDHHRLRRPRASEAQVHAAVHALHPDGAGADVHHHRAGASPVRAVVAPPPGAVGASGGDPATPRRARGRHRRRGAPQDAGRRLRPAALPQWREGGQGARRVGRSDGRRPQGPRRAQGEEAARPADRHIRVHRLTSCCRQPLVDCQHFRGHIKKHPRLQRKSLPTLVIRNNQRL